MKPVCESCRVFFKCDKNSVAWIEGAPGSDGTWHPYRLWESDRWKCPGCGATILVGTGRVPVAERHEHGFDRTVALYCAEVTVNDC